MGLLEFAVAVPVIGALVAAFALAARRLLGVRIGLVRMLVAGAVALAGIAVFSLVMQRPEQQGVLTAVQYGSALVLTATFLAALEVVLPSGSVGGPILLLRGARMRVSRTVRYCHILRIAVRHGLRPYLRGGAASRPARLARPLRLALEEAGATFVKLGQMLSTRQDMLPPEFVRELSLLQYQVPPEPWESVAESLRREFGEALDVTFAAFDREPLAAASIAQVHTGTLHSGERVVVKVRRPGAGAVIERDLDIIWRIAVLLEKRTAWARAMGVTELATGFAVSLREELDFRVEARNLATIASGGSRRDADDPPVRLPAVHEDLSGEGALVMEYLPGVPVSAAGARLAELAGEARARLARRLLAGVVRQLLVGGVFHADPHPGNVLVLDGGRVGLIDFGSVGRIDARVRSGLRGFMLAVYRGDTVALCDALLEVVEAPEDIDERELERDLGRFLVRHFVPGMPIDFESFETLFRLVASHGLKIPPEIAAVFRALATLEGTLRRICPGFDMVEEARTIAPAEVAGGRNFVLGDETPSSMSAELAGVWTVLRRFPRRLDRVTSALEQGRLVVGARLFADPRDRSYVRGLVHDVLLTFMGATCGLMAAILFTVERGPLVTEELQLFDVFGYHLLVLSALFIIRVLFHISKVGR